MIIELDGNKDKEFYHFNLIDPRYGRAEFVVCPIYRRGKLKEFYVYTEQQEVNKIWHVVNTDSYLSINSHPDIEKPWAWLLYWCPEHKTNSIRIYAPDGSSVLVIDRYGLTFLREIKSWEK